MLNVTSYGQRRKEELRFLAYMVCLFSFLSLFCFLGFLTATTIISGAVLLVLSAGCGTTALVILLVHNA